MRCLIAFIVAAAVMFFLRLAAGFAGTWSSPLFFAGLGLGVFLPLYDLVTDGEMKRGILVSPFVILAAAAAAKFLGL